jgi:hypothetical protein
MTACPKCEAENPADAAVCWRCHAEICADGHEEIPTLRTKPKLLVLRPAAKPTETARTPPTDHGSGAPADPAMTPAVPAMRLRVVRGLRVNVEYPLFDGRNVIGRGDDEPVDVDLRDQEPRDRIWASRIHATITAAEGVLTLEDLNSTNGTYVNRHRLFPGSKRILKADDILQIGTTQLKVVR